MACTAEGIIGGGRCHHCQSSRSSIAALARPWKALLIVLKPCVHRSAAGDVLRAEDRVRNDADRALRCGRPCGHAGSWRCSSASGGD